MRMPIVIKKITRQGCVTLHCSDIRHGLEVIAAAIVPDFFETSNGPAPPTTAVNRSLKYRLTYTQFALFKPEKQVYIPIQGVKRIGGAI